MLPDDPVRLTLGLVVMVVGLFSVLVMWNLRRVNPDQPGPGHWLLASFLFALAFAALPAANALNLPRGPVLALNNAVGVAAGLVTIEGFLRFKGNREAQLWRVGAVLVPLIAGLGYALGDHPVYRYRILDITLAVLLGIVVFICLHNPPPEVRGSLQKAAGIAALLASAFASRWVLAMTSDPDADLLVHPMQKVYLVLVLVYMVGWIHVSGLMCYERLHARVVRQSLHDDLTGLPNRRAFEQHTQVESAKATRGENPFALAMMDLNGFKQVNDIHGHLAGDAMLEEVARRIAGNLREGDFAARLGGDEFCVVLAGVGDAEQAEHARERLRQAVDGPVSWRKTQLTIAASIGVAIWGADGTDLVSLKEQSDERMYEDKARIKSQP